MSLIMRGQSVETLNKPERNEAKAPDYLHNFVGHQSLRWRTFFSTSR